jgi:hypothetical protein
MENIKNMNIGNMKDSLNKNVGIKEPSLLDTLKDTISKTTSTVTTAAQDITENVKSKATKTMNNINPLSDKSLLPDTQSLSKPTNGLSKIGDSIKSQIPGQKSDSQKVFDKFSLGTSQSNVLGVTKQESGMGKWAIRFGLLLIILGLLSANIWAYLQKGTDLFSEKLRNAVSSNGNSIFDSVENSFDNAVVGTSFGAGVIADSFKSVINVFRKIINFKKEEEKTDKPKKVKKTGSNDVEKVLKKDKNNEKVNPDSTKSSIQEPKPGICFVGYQTPHNACVQVDDVKKCISGKIFNSMDECRNQKKN